MAVIEIAAICMVPATASAIVSKIVAVGGVVNGVLASVTMDVDQYVNWSTGLFYKTYAESILVKRF